MRSIDNFKTRLRNFHEIYFEGSYQSKNKKQLYRMYKLTEEGYNILVSSYHVSIRKLNELKSVKMDKFYPTKEDSCLSVIETAFSDYESIREYRVGDYRVDLYFPEVNIVIEVDEFNHKDRKSVLEITREIFIEAELSCSFIRFNPDDDTFNIGNTIKNIREILLQKGAV